MPENLNCRSENVVYLTSWKTCHKQYTGSSEEFRARFNNYRCAHRNYCKNMKVKQESFHAHVADGVRSGEGDWEVRLINQSDSTEDLRKGESFWQHEFNTFQPNGLNELEVALLLVLFYYYFLFIHCHALYNGGSKALIRLLGRGRSCLVYTRLGMFGLGICRRDTFLPI